MNRSRLAAACLFFGATVGLANAQDAVLAELYGQGVHAYFAHDATTAQELFTSAIEQGSRDPRCYYFRGLSYLLLGRPDEAETDFNTGAVVEVEAADRVYPVANSLQRVQGWSRMKIEKHRQTARVASLSKAYQNQRVRYEQMKRSEKDSLRGSKPQPASPRPGAAPAAEKSDPFAGDMEAKPEKAPAKAAEPAAAPATPADPFSAPAEPAAPAMPAEDAKTDPFSDDKAAPAEPAAPTAEKPAAADDPFN